MNSDKHSARSQRGNAMIYILISLALLAGLTLVISRSGDSGGDDLSAEQNELLTTRTVAYVGSAKNTVDQMMMSGTPVASLDFLRPDDVGYDTAPYHNRVFHPQGGGLSIEAPDPKVFISADDHPKAGWYMGRFNNVEWTPTAAPDVLFVAYGIGRALCESLNKKITGNTTIPVVGDFAEELFVDDFWGGGANVNFTEAVCPACEGWPSLCVSDGADYVYYNIMSGQ